MRWFGGELRRPVGDVLADRETHDMVPRVLGCDVLAARADDDDQFALVVTTVAAHLDVCGRPDDARRELGEHERARRRLDAALGRVGPVVETDAEGLLRPGYGRPQHDIGQQPRDRRLVEPRRQLSEQVGSGERFHRIGAEQPRRVRGEVGVAVAGHQRSATVDVGKSESHGVDLSVSGSCGAGRGGDVERDGVARGGWDHQGRWR